MTQWNPPITADEAAELARCQQDARNWSSMLAELEADVADHKRRIAECEEHIKQTARKLARSRA